MKTKIWAVTLAIAHQEKLETRLLGIIQYLSQIYPQSQWVISDIDSTGSYGNKLTCRANQEEFYLSPIELLTVCQEDGQIIDLEATLVASEQELCKILVQDGVSIDVLGVGDLLPEIVLGEYIVADLGLFLWHPERSIIEV